MPAPEIKRIAAKSDRSDPTLWLPFQMHALDTAGIIERLFYKWLPFSVQQYISVALALGFDADSREEQTVNYCRLLALLHDIGKLTPAFQSKLALRISGYNETLTGYGIDLSSLPDASASPHAIAGEAILLNAGFPGAFCEIVGTHHGKHSGSAEHQIADHSQNYFGYRKQNQNEWSELWQEWIHYALAETQFTVESLPEPDVPCQMLLTGLLIMADWLASNTDYFPYISADCTAETDTRRLDSAWETIGFPDIWSPEIQHPYEKWFDSRFGFAPNPVQQNMMQTVSENPAAGIYILEAPMGIGKTEAALAAAEILADKLGLGGVFFGLPTQATANGIFSRILQWASKCDSDTHSIRLAHGMTELNEAYQSVFHGTAADSGDASVIVHEWFEGRKQALLSDFVTATVDQFLLASLKQKHCMMRHLGLAGKAVIIDECHAYDAYMNVYLDRTLRWMGAYGVPVIILSATLPPQRREQLVRAYLGISFNKELPYQTKSNPNAYPVLTWTSDKSVYQRAVSADAEKKAVTVGRLPETDLVSELASRLQNGGCAAIIVNTVRYAQELSRCLSEQLSGFDVICFHSRFLASDRAEIEQKLLARTGKKSDAAARNRLIVVGTQVIEQSLDLDFDLMITELCPMDLLLQRSGRLHRHDRKRPEKLRNPELLILEPQENHAMIYDAWILKQTELHLPDTLVIPACIPGLVSAVYDAADEQNPLFQAYKRMISGKETKASAYCINSKNLGSKYKNLLSYFLDDDVGSTKEAEASVRDTDETIEVIVLKKTADQMYSLMNGTAEFDPTLPISEQEAKQIAREHLRLPLFYSKYHFADTLKALDIMPEKWRESAWINGEMLLLTDENADAVLCGRKLHYDRNYGLTEPEKG